MPKLVDSDERREFIARIAAELIAEEGIEKATIREIAKRAGATRGLVEHHFRNKAEMIELLVEARLGGDRGGLDLVAGPGFERVLPSIGHVQRTANVALRRFRKGSEFLHLRN